MKRSILITVLLSAFLLKCLDTKSQSIFYGYSNVFTLGNPVYEAPNIFGYSNIFPLGSSPIYEAPNIFGYSGVFDINTRGHYISGYSNWFMLNTVGGIIQGQITDSQTGLPIQGAVVKSLNYTSNPSDAQGNYKLYVPFGYGYIVSAVAQNYEVASVAGVHLPYSQPVYALNFQLSSTAGTLAINALLPDPNPALSTVQKGGKFHRYYKVVNTSTGHSLALIPVMVTGNMLSRTFVSNEEGIVDIAIDSYLIGNGQPGDQASFSISSANNVPLAVPVTFNAKVTAAGYEKYWDNKNYAKLGVNFMGIDLSGKLERGSVTSLAKSSDSPLISDFINIKRQGRAGIGVGFKVKSPGVKGKLGPVKGGIGAEAGLGVSFTGTTEDNYQFGYESVNNWDAVAKYILIADGNYKSIDNAMIRLLSLFETKFTGQSTLNETFVSDGVGIDVSQEASAEAFAGIEVTKHAKIGAGANIGAEGHAAFQTFYHQQDNELEFNFGVSGKFAGSAGVGLKMDFGSKKKKKDLETMLNIWDTESSVGLQFSTFLDGSSPNPIKRFELKHIRRNLFSKFEEETIFSIEVDEDLLNDISELRSEISQIANSYQFSTNIQVNNSTFKQILEAVFDFLYDIQINQSGEATISYQKELTKISASPSFDLDLGLSLTAVSLNIGGGIGFEQGKKMMVESGKWALGKAYINENYSADIPEIPISYQQVLQQIIDDVPMWLKLLIGTINVLTPGKDDMTFDLGNNGSFIVFPDGAFPQGIDSVHCSSWSWYGDDPSKHLSDVEPDKKYILKENKQRAEELYGMTYGIGGFYQLEPYGTPLPDTAWLTIVYSEEEADSLDESSQGMYWEDKANHRWVYIGGVLDTINNTVTAPVNQLSLFTLAPAMPFGTFGLNAVPDSIYADSISLATIFSDTIFNNNLLPVNNGEKFTVATTNGKILTADADTTIDGIQVIAANHQIQFEIRSSHIGGTAMVSAFSVNGSANAVTAIRFYDTIPPAPPVLAEAIPDSTTANLCWLPNTEADLAGYVLFYDTDTIPPFTGIHTVYGQPSPIYTGTDTTKTVNGLFNDTTYYFAVTAIDVEGNESGYSNFRMVKPVVVKNQQIQLPQGWSGVSSYISPMAPEIGQLFDPVAGNLIILQNQTGMYWPGENINTLGEWNTQTGYKIKMANPAELTVTGSRQIDKTLPLAQSWNLIPVLSACNADIATLFDSKPLVLAKEVAGGNLYWPQFGINTLSALEPGKAYFVLMNAGDSITFPDCESGMKNGMTTSAYHIENEEQYQELLSGFGITRTAITHTIALPGNILSELVPGDLILVTDHMGKCFGIAAISEGNIAMTLYGNDPFTPVKDGFDEQDALYFKLLRGTDEYPLEVALDDRFAQSENEFIHNGISALKSVKVLNNSGLPSAEAFDIQIIPNPAKDEFRLVLPDYDLYSGSLKILSTEGQCIGFHKLSGKETVINISQLHPGVYILRIEMGDFVVYKRMVKN